MKRPTLSPEMVDCYEFAAANGGKLHREAGGFWCGRNGRSGPTFGTSTVQALVKRNVATYSVWKDRERGYPFSVEMTVKPIPE
jgi:hypothetical protein